MPSRKAILIAIAAVLPVWAAAAVAPKKILVLPFSALGRADEKARVMDVLTTDLARMGYEVALPELAEPLLEELRIRYLDSMSKGSVNQLLQDTGAGALITGSYWLGKAELAPEVAIMARLVGPDGELWWAGVKAMTSDDTKGAFGAGHKKTLEALAPSVSHALLDSLPNPGDRVPVKGLSRPGGGGHARSATAAGRAQGQQTLALLPLQNFTEDRSAAKIIESLLLLRLGAHHVSARPVEPAELRRALVDEKLPPFRVLGPDEMKKVAAKVGATLVLQGAVYNFGNTADLAGQISPEVVVSLSLFDVTSGKVVWHGMHGRTGKSYEGWLGMGRVRTLVGVADATLSELLSTLPSD